MKTLLTPAAGYLLALAAGIGGAWWSAAPRPPENTRATSNGTADKPGKFASRDDNRSSQPQHPVGSIYRQAWDLLTTQSPSDRKKLIPLLLDEWIKHDPAAALEAILGEDESAELLEHFSALFEDDPQNFKEIFAGERFGLATAKVRDWWIMRMAERDPAGLLTQAAEFGPITRDKIVTTCVEIAKNQPERLKAMIGEVASRPDTPANQQVVVTLARALASHMDSQELLDRLIEVPGAMGAAMIGGAMVTMLEKTDVEGARATFARLPDDLRLAAVKATLAKPGQNVSGYLAAMDEVMNTPEWVDLKQPLTVSLHQIRAKSVHNTALLEWASHMPERDDTMELYRVAVSGSISDNPQATRERISKMEPGWKQQNSLAAYVQSALVEEKDEAGARWAFQQITDPVFRTEAQGFFRAYDARKATR